MQKRHALYPVPCAAVFLSAVFVVSAALAASRGIRSFIINAVQDHVVHKPLVEAFWQEYITLSFLGSAIVSALLLLTLFFMRREISSRLEAILYNKKKAILLCAALAALLIIASCIFYTVSALLFVFMFYLIIFLAMKTDGKGVSIKGFTPLHKAAIAFIVLFFIVFTIYWARQNNSIYEWDYGTYWQNSVAMSAYVFSNPFFKTLGNLYISINNNTRNILLSLITALPMKIFGNAFSVFVSSCCIMFLLPAILVQSLIAVKLNRGTLKNNTVFVMAAFLAAIFPPNYYAVFRGFVDTACLLTNSCALYLFIDFDTRRLDIKRDIGIAILLSLSWLERRYVVYFLIGYVAAFAVKSLMLLLKEKKVSINSLKNILLNAYIIGVASLTSLLLFFFKFVWGAVSGGYSHEYGDWDMPFIIKILGALKTFTLPVALIIVCTAVLCLRLKKHRITYVYLAVLAISLSLTFYHTQNMDVHHKMLLNLSVFLTCLLPLCLYGRGRAVLNGKVKAANVIANCTVLIFILNFISAFYLNMPNYLFSYRHERLYREDTDKVIEVVDMLSSLTKGTGDKIYVAASGVTLNGSTLQRAKAPKEFYALDNLLMSNADIRDGFNMGFFDAKYCVATAPTETLTMSKVSVYLSCMIQDASSYIGVHYKKIYELPLQNGIKAVVYERISDFSLDDKKRIGEYFDALYPDDTNKFSGRILSQ